MVFARKWLRPVLFLVLAGFFMPRDAAAHEAHGPEDIPPGFEVDPHWPKALPNDWIFGQVAGAAVDKRDHIWVIHRPR